MSSLLLCCLGSTNSDVIHVTCFFFFICVLPQHNQAAHGVDTWQDLSAYNVQQLLNWKSWWDKGLGRDTILDYFVLYFVHTKRFWKSKQNKLIIINFFTKTSNF